MALTTQLPVIKVLTGCTASGKTEWALRYAQSTGAEIISADSLLFYRGLDIGTAKPTKQELNLIKHHLIDVMDLNESMNIAHYVTLAQQIVKEIHFKKKTVLVVGGSGFYLKSFFKAVADQLNSVTSRIGLEKYGTEGEAFDPQIHEALMHETSSDVVVATASKILQPGYKYKERILRPARVKVTDPAGE